MTTAIAAPTTDLDARRRADMHERYLTAVTRARAAEWPEGPVVLNDNSRDYYRWQKIVERIACAMVGDHLTGELLTAVDNVAAETWGELEDRLVACIEADRAR